MGQPNIHNMEGTHVSSPHIQADRDEISHLFPSISENPSRDFSEGDKKPGVQASVSGGPTELWSPRPSVRRNSFGGGEGDPFTPRDRGGVQDWVNSTSGLSGPDFIPKPHNALELTPFNINPHEHNAQERHDTENDKASPDQQQNNEPYRPMVSPLKEDGNRATSSRENDKRHGHDHEGSKVWRM